MVNFALQANVVSQRLIIVSQRLTIDIIKKIDS